MSTLAKNSLGLFVLFDKKDGELSTALSINSNNTNIKKWGPEFNPNQGRLKLNDLLEFFSQGFSIIHLFFHGKLRITQVVTF